MTDQSKINPAHYSPNLRNAGGSYPRCVVCYTTLDKSVEDMDDALCSEHADTEFEDV
jgi:hypothetical protein